MRAELRARASTHDHETLGLQFGAMTTDVRNRSWDLASRVMDIGSGGMDRPRARIADQGRAASGVDVVVVVGCQDGSGT